MRAAFCSSPMCDVHGHPKGRRRIFITGSSKTGSPPLAPSAFLLSTGTLGSTCSFVRITSLTGMSNGLYNTSCDTFVGRSSCCGIADPSTASVPFSLFLMHTRDSITSFSHRMHLNLTQPNTSGIDQTLPFPTTYPTIAQSSTTDCILLQPNSDPHRNAFGHAFTLLICPGKGNSSFLYLCESQ